MIKTICHTILLDLLVICDLLVFRKTRLAILYNLY
jgi:hypothetical protein